MIGKLSGMVDSVGETEVILDVGGVGYVVFCSTRTLGEIPAPGLPVRLLIETHVREDHIHLYGFADPAEREWFRLLTTVQGVGAKLALAILGALSPGALAQAIVAQDRAMLTQANGVGPKLAGRIAAELKDKVSGLVAPLSPAEPQLAPVGGALADAVSALVNLGYGQPQAAAAIAAAARSAGEGADAARLIRLGLKELAK